MFYTILKQVAWPTLFIFIIMARMHLTQDHWVDSTLALPWERRSASEQHFHGVRLCAYTYITPFMQILYLVSIGQHHVPLHLMVWWPWLLPLSCFAARFCHSTSLVVSVEGHHQTCLPLKNPWPHVAWLWPKACLSLKVCCCIFISSIAQEHLPWPIFYVALSLSFLWARHDTSKLLNYTVCLNSLSAMDGRDHPLKN